ncbi:MAG: hypothetical protein ACI9UV_003061, partial [Algoriphagus sp.]
FQNRLADYCQSKSKKKGSKTNRKNGNCYP